MYLSPSADTIASVRWRIEEIQEKLKNLQLLVQEGRFDEARKFLARSLLPSRVTALIDHTRTPADRNAVQEITGEPYDNYCGRLIECIKELAQRARLAQLSNKTS